MCLFTICALIWVNGLRRRTPQECRRCGSGERASASQAPAISGIAFIVCLPATPPQAIRFWRTTDVTKTIKVALAGAGAFGIKHLDGIRNIDGVEVVSLVGRRLDATQEVAAKYGIAHVSTELADSLALKEVDAVILCTPTQMHTSQSIACLKAGKHV
jgi:D-arabinose 1-dehydrogenase-like Zn-dependent alcohol dehydrogenase